MGRALSSTSSLQCTVGRTVPSMSFFENSHPHDPGAGVRVRMRGSHDVRLRSMLDRDLYVAGVLNEEREVLASRSVLGRHSPFFRTILSTVPVGEAISHWTCYHDSPPIGWLSWRRLCTEYLHQLGLQVRVFAGGL